MDSGNDYPVSAYGARMLRMIDLSLDLFKMETGVYCLKAEPVDLLAVIRRIVAELGPIVASKELTLAVSVDGAPGNGRTFMVHGDELLCHSMLANLIKNAVEASPEGEIVGISLGREAAGSEILIRNKGSMPADMRARFFEKYATSGKPGGTGLGAYSARLIAETHGGAVCLDTPRPGETTLKVFLPNPDGSREFTGRADA